MQRVTANVHDVICTMPLLLLFSFVLLCLLIPGGTKKRLEHLHALFTRAIKVN